MASGLALVVCDANGEFLVRNRAAHRLLSGSSEGGEDRLEDADDEVRSFLKEVLAAEEPVHRRWLELRHSGTGSRVRCPAVGLRIPDHQRGVSGAVAVLGLWHHDGAKTLSYPEEAVVDARDSSRRKTGVGYLGHDALGAVSHELRTPINAVVGYAALLHERLLGDLSEEQDRAVRRIEAAAQQLLAAVNHALLLAHIEVGDFEAGDFASGRGSLDQDVSS